VTDDPEPILCELLVLRCRRGDVGAWRELTARFERRLLYFLRRLTDDERDAWDLLQQTWMAAVKQLAGLDEPRALRTWLYRVAHHQAVSLGRRDRRRPAVATDPADLQAVPDDAWADDTFAADAAADVHAALARLSLPHREVLTLHFLEEMPVADIAAVVGVPPGTVKSRLFHAKRALRAALDGDGRFGGDPP
jgi:RNA polymerase sigma-70 factor (ECF subfamily)